MLEDIFAVFREYETSDNHGDIIAPEPFFQVFGTVEAFFITDILMAQEMGTDDEWFPRVNAYWLTRYGLSSYQVRMFCKKFAPYGLSTKLMQLDGRHIQHYHLDLAMFKSSFAMLYKQAENAPPPYVKINIPARLRIAVFRRDGFCCQVCGSQENLAVDHIIPEIRGGSLDMENLQTLCKSCNSRKRDR